MYQGRQSGIECFVSLHTSNVVNSPADIVQVGPHMSHTAVLLLLLFANQHKAAGVKTKQKLIIIIIIIIIKNA